MRWKWNGKRSISNPFQYSVPSRLGNTGWRAGQRTRGATPLAAHWLASHKYLRYRRTCLWRYCRPVTRQPRSRPGAVIRRWQRNCPYKPLRGRTYAYTQNDRHHNSTGRSCRTEVTHTSVYNIIYCITDKVATNTHRQFSTLCRHMPLVSISYGALLRICLII